MSFVAALAVAELAREYVPASLVALKWPNDVMLGGEKLSGVLIESGPSGDGLWLAVGIGVNLASAPSIPDRPATHLAAHLKSDVARPPTLEEALEEDGALRLRLADGSLRRITAGDVFFPNG